MQALVFVILEILAKLGIFFISYQGLSYASNEAIGYITSSIGGLPASAVGLLGLSQTDTAINIILSATVAKFSLLAAGKRLGFGGRA